MKRFSFKSSRVQSFNRIVFGFLVLTLELLNPFNLEPASAQQTPFYQGKTIRIIVGYQPGDNHDQYARTYARFMGKYIPGNPNFVIQNMPGAGSMIAANHVYNMTKPDGLTLGSFGGALIMAQLTGRKEAQFDWPKYGWIGTPYRAGHLLFMRTDAPAKTLDQLRQGNDPPRCSASGVGSTGYDIPRLLEDSLGMKFKIISGYPGGADQDLAMERNEVNCRAITIDGFFAREPFISWVKKGFVHVLLHTEKQRHRQDTQRADRLRTDGSVQGHRRQTAPGQHLLGTLGLRLHADRHHARSARRAGQAAARSVFENLFRCGISGRRRRRRAGSRAR